MIRVTSPLLTLVACSGMTVAQFGTDTVVNGDFENGDPFFSVPDNWVPFNNGGGLWTDSFNNTPGGTWSVSIPLVSGFNAWQPVTADRSMVVPVPPISNGGEVELKFFVNMPGLVEADVVGAKIDWFDANGSRTGDTGDLVVEERMTTGWQEETFVVTPDPGATTARIFLFTFDDGGPGGSNPNPPSGTVYFDDVSLVQMMGEGACAPADLADEFGVLNSEDLLVALDNIDADAILFSQSDNRLPNASFEEGFDDPDDDPDQGEIPAGWFSFNFDPDSDFYLTSGENGAPPARTGNRLVAVGPDGSSFHGWAGTPNANPDLPDTAVRYNLQNEFLFEGWFNIPEAIDDAVVGVKLEFLSPNDEGGFGEFFGGYTPPGAPNSDLIISDGSATDGWQRFEFRFDASTFNPVAERVRPLLFLFDGGGVTGTIYFDDIFLGQESIQRGDFNEDGVTNFFDLIEAAAAVDEGCPGA